MIVIRSDEEIGSIRKAGEIVALTLEKLSSHIASGVATSELDGIAREEILRRGGSPAFKDYRGYPANICTSINEVVVHGIPSGRRLKEGDIISVDIGVKFRDYYADGAVTVGVGDITVEAKALMTATKAALGAGIEKARPGSMLTDISAAIQGSAETNGFNVVRVFVGHGIGTRIHEDPEIPNFGPPGRGPRLEAGMVLAIEPMVNAGTFEVEILDDGWTAVTKDRRLSAHYEHTVAVRAGGAEILTRV